MAVTLRLLTRVSVRKLIVFAVAEDGEVSSRASRRVFLRKLSVQHSDLAIDLFHFRGNPQVCQSGGRFGVAFGFRRELIRTRLKDQPQRRELCQFD